MLSNMYSYIMAQRKFIKHYSYPSILAVQEQRPYSIFITNQPASRGLLYRHITKRCIYWQDGVFRLGDRIDGQISLRKLAEMRGEAKNRE